MDHVTFRPAAARDTPAVLALWAQARSAAAATPDDDVAVMRVIDQPGSTLLVAEDSGRIVGSLIVAWDGWRGNMYRLAVLASYRRRGIAGRLVELGHRHLEAVGARRVTALVAHRETEATGLWSSLGYERDEQIARFVRNL